MANLPHNFVGHVRALEWTRAKVERLYNQGFLVRRDVELVYEGLYLDCVTSFESSIEYLFIQILTGHVTLREVTARVAFKSSMVARDVLLGGEKKYLDWLPYDKAEKRAQAYFRGGFPFTKFTSTEKKTIEEMLIIRNAIAHESSYSYNRFQKFVSGLPLTPREKTSAGFLRSHIDPTTTRFQFYVADMARMITSLYS
jgi:hypothetical protein